MQQRLFSLKQSPYQIHLGWRKRQLVTVRIYFAMHSLYGEYGRVLLRTQTDRQTCSARTAVEREPQAAERAAPTSTPTHPSAGWLGASPGFWAGGDSRMLAARRGVDVLVAHHVHLFTFRPIPSSFEVELPSPRQLPKAQGMQRIPGFHRHSSRRGNTKFTSTVERQGEKPGSVQQQRSLLLLLGNQS